MSPFPLCFSACIVLCPPPNANHWLHHLTRSRAPSMGPWESAKPCVVGATVLPMPKSKTAEGRVAAAHFGRFVFFLC